MASDPQLAEAPAPAPTEATGATVPAGSARVVGSGSAADDLMRRLLRVPEAPPSVSRRQVERAFSTAMVLSGLRCLLSYVVFPFVLPFVGLAAGGQAAVGLPVAAVAMVFDVRGIRRVWLSTYRHRWALSALYLAVMVLVAVLLVQNVATLVR